MARTVEINSRWENERWDVTEDMFCDDWEKDIDDLLWETFDDIWTCYGLDWGDERIKCAVWDLMYQEMQDYVNQIMHK